MDQSVSDGGGRDHRMRWRILIVVFVAVVIALAVYRQRVPREAEPPRTVTLYGFSILESALEEDLLPAFKRVWRERTGERVEFITTYAGSAWLTDEVLRKVSAAVAILASKIDAGRLVDNGALSGPVWEQLPRGGVVSESPIVIVVRPGNPLGIHDFADLAREGVRLDHADPRTSGLGEWGVLAVYASAGPGEGNPTERLEAVWRNVADSEASARALRLAFERGVGDAMITYEEEALRTRDAEIVYPRRTLMSEHVVCRIGRHIKPEQAGLVDALIEFLWSPESQSILRRHGFRPVEPESGAGEGPRFGRIEQILTLDDLGGAERARRDILEAVWRDRILAEPPPGE